jgi:xylulose-5-phosphate/fructose-6-phosphate phosphoketolase
LEVAIHNQVDRFDLAIDVIDRVPKLQGRGAYLEEELKGRSLKASTTSRARVWTNPKAGTGGGP